MIGFLNIYKPSGMSSAAVVGKLKRKFGIKKIGHMGTLDPLACGVLPIAVGKATRMFDYFLSKHKTYIVEAEFGYRTPSLDLGTDIQSKTEIIPTLSEIIEKCSDFIGIIDQLPPIYSAKSINGVRAYELARKGEDVDLKPIKVEILKFKCINQITDTKFLFEIKCSSGTYVRSLIDDLAVSLNSLATVTKLERVNSGYFNVEDSIDLEELLNKETIFEYITKIDDVFSNYRKINIDSNQFFKIRNGISIEINESNQENIFVEYNGDLVGVGCIQNKLFTLKTFLLQD